MFVGGTELGLAQHAPGGLARSRSIQAALVEGTPDGVGRAEQGSRQPGGRSRIHGLMEGEGGDRIDSGSQRRAFHPGRGRAQRGGEQLAAADLVPFPQDHQGQPGHQLSAHPVPPRRLLLVQPGQDLGAVGGRRGQVTLLPVQVRAHQGQPGSRVVQARAALGLGVLGLLQVGPGALQIAHPESDRGEHAVDIRNVPPCAQLPAERRGVIQGRDRGRVVPPQLGELGQLDQHRGRPPCVPQGTERSQRVPAVGLGQVDAAEHAAERAAQHRHGRPDPGIS